MIRELVLTAAVIYVLINLVQVIRRPAVGVEGLIIGTGLLVAAALYWTRDEHNLHRWESAALWAAVLLFVAYGILRYGGVL